MPGGRNSEANPHPESYFYVVSAGRVRGLHKLLKIRKSDHFSSRWYHPGCKFFMLHMKMQPRSGMHENAKTDSAGWLSVDKKKLRPAPKRQNTRPRETTPKKLEAYHFWEISAKFGICKFA